MSVRVKWGYSLTLWQIPVREQGYVLVTLGGDMISTLGKWLTKIAQPKTFIKPSG